YGMDDESAAVAIHAAMLREHFHFLLGWEPSMSWSAFLLSIENQRRGINLSPYQVRGRQLVAEVDGEIIGRVSLRFELNEYLTERGGHVGYGVAPAHRRKGYATEILRQALVVIRAEGVDPVLVACDDDNVASSRTIERNGGVLESIAPPNYGEVESVRRYWIK
ncbi:MAG: GNAT family N-acetyltransferase, partial [Alphaproteobacteria bacterium]